MAHSPPRVPRQSRVTRRSSVTRRSRSPRTIALIGMDGSGKTTQAHRLADALHAAGRPAVYRRNAGGRHWFGKLAVRLGRADADDLLGRRGMLLVEAVLRWLAILRTLLRRAVTGEISVMDRYAFCQYASLRARGAHPSAERLARLAYRLFPRPDVTFLLVVDPAVAHDRIDARGYDHETMDYLNAAAAAYRSLPEHPSFVVIDANTTPDAVHAALLSHLQPDPVPQLDPVPQEPSPTGDPAGAMADARRRVRTRTLLLAGGPLVAGAAFLGYQLADAL